MLRAAAHDTLDPFDAVVKGLRAWNDIERDRQSSAVIEVTNPQLRASEFPLRIRLLLKEGKIFQSFAFSCFEKKMGKPEKSCVVRDVTPFEVLRSVLCMQEKGVYFSSLFIHKFLELLTNGRGKR